MRRCIPAALVALVVGCTPIAERSNTLAGGQEPEPLTLDSRSQLLYHLLVAEFAGNRDELETAASEYATAAKLSDDPAVAERATRVALYAEREQLALEAAERWLAVAPGSGEAQQALGLLQLRTGNIDAAFEQFVASVPTGPNREPVLAKLGTLLAQEAEPVTTLPLMRRLAKAFPQQRSAHYAHAQVALAAGAGEEAVAALDRALALRPGWRPAQLLRVEALLAQDRPDEALDSLSALLERAPEDYDLRLQYARTLVDLSRTQAALKQFRRLLERRPEDGRVLYAGALLALEAGKTDLARGWLERLLPQEQRTDAARFYLARIAELEENHDEAIDLYSRAAGDFRQEAQLRIAVVTAAAGDLEAARERLRQFRRDNPEMAAEGWAVEGEILRSADRPQRSIAVFSEGLKRFPDNANLLYGRAMTYVQQDLIAAAEADLRALLEQEPDAAQALNALGYTLADRTERYEEAAELIERAYALRPDDPAVIDSMGWIAYRRGQYEAAVGYLRRAYELADDAEIAAHLGEALWQLGRRDEAREVWNEALRNHPESEVLRQTIERFEP